MNKRITGAGAILVGIAIFTAIWSQPQKQIPAASKTAMEGIRQSGGAEVQSAPLQAEKDIIQVYLFHSTRRCRTCIAIGELTAAAVNEYYPEEIKSGRIEFREINVDMGDNRKLAEKFQASGAGLYVNNHRDGKDNITEDTDVWRLTGNADGFKTHIKEKIDNMLME